MAAVRPFGIGELTLSRSDVEAPRLRRLAEFLGRIGVQASAERADDGRVRWSFQVKRPLLTSRRKAVGAAAREPAAGQALADAIRAAMAERCATPRSVLGFDEAIDLVCSATGWPVGHVWVKGPAGWRSSGALHLDRAVQHPRDGALTALRDCTALTDLGSGRGIVAAVLHLEACRFLPGLDGLGSPGRARHAQLAGLRGVVGVPVRSATDHVVDAVLEFVTATDVEPDGSLAEALLDVASRTRRRTARKTATRQHRNNRPVESASTATQPDDETRDLAG